MAYDKTGHTRYPGQRLKDVIGPHVAVLHGVTFDAELNFTAAGVQYYNTLNQSSHIQFSKADVNSDDESGNVIASKIITDGSYTLTFTSDFIQARSDFVGLPGTYYLYFTYQYDGTILYSIIQA